MVYYRFSDYLKQRYGEKVYKIPIALPVTCPNRDGSLGRGGCTFCGPIGAGYESLPASMSVTEQIEANKRHIVPKYKAKKFIAYLQNYSNTYLPLERLEGYLEEAAKAADMVAIYIATRPDCISESYLNAIKKIQELYKIDICIELGLQTVNPHSLVKINRGHSLAEFIDAVLRIKRYDMQVCAHMILNLPYDDELDVIEGAKILSALNVDQVKLHALYIIKGTPMAKAYEDGNLKLISLSAYEERVIAFLQYLSPNIIIQRIIGRAPAENTLFANWGTGWWKIHDTIVNRMETENIYQGRLCDYLNGHLLKNFANNNC